MKTVPKGSQAYDEFEVVISPRDQVGLFQARAQSVVGSRAEDFRLPVAPSEWPSVRRQLARLVLASDAASQQPATERGAVDLGSAEISTDALLSHRTFGVDLFNALFTGQVRALFEMARQRAMESKRAGIRLRLTFSFTDNTAEWFTDVLNLPWELMAPSEDENPIVINSQSPIVRSFDRITQQLDVIEPPIRVLVISASPKGTQSLAVDAEVARMKSQWSKAPSVLFNWKPAHLEVVETEMEQFRPHIVHFIGHGDVVNGRGVLLFERSADRSVHQMDASALAGLFARDSLRLVYLNSCRGAEVGSEDDSSPFAGVATSLAKNHVPAVIAMQFPVTDTTAVAFCDTFYKYLVQGYPIDAAVGTARRFVFSRGTREWATPVLFLREPDAQLIRKPSAAHLVELESFASRGVVEIITPESAGHTDTFRVEQADADEEDFVVFLASATKSVDQWLIRAQTEMTRMGWTVVRPKEPVWSDYAPLFKQLTRCCHLFVHIVGPRPGNEIAEVPESEPPYHAVQQFNIAFESAASQLVIFPQGTPRKSADPYLSQMLECIETSRREQSQLQSIECDIERLGEHLRAHFDIMQRTELEAAGNSAAPSDAVFVDVHETDIDATRPLLSTFDTLGVRWMLSPAAQAAYDRAPAPSPAADTLKEFRDLVLQVPLMIVPVGTVNAEWVLGRLREGFKASAQRDQPTNLAVVRLPGNAAPPTFPSYTRVFGNESGFTDQDVAEMLKLRYA